MKTTTAAAVVAAAATACAVRAPAPDPGATRLSSPVVSAAPAEAERPSLLVRGTVAKGRPVMARPVPSAPVPLKPVREERAPVAGMTVESVRRMLGKEASK